MCIFLYRRDKKDNGEHFYKLDFIEKTIFFDLPTAQKKCDNNNCDFCEYGKTKDCINLKTT